MECFFGKVFRTGPIKSNVRKRGLSPPTRRNIEPKDEVLHLLQHVVVCLIIDISLLLGVCFEGYIIFLYIITNFFRIFMNKRREIGIKWGERLSSCPLILKGSEEVDHLVHRCLKISRRSGFYTIRHPVKTLFEELTQTPSGTVPRKHIEIMNVVIPISMRIPHLTRVDMREPVVGCNFPGCIEDKSPERVPTICIRIDSPIGLFKVFVHSFSDFDNDRAICASLSSLCTIDDICFCNSIVSIFYENLLDRILNKLYIRNILSCFFFCSHDHLINKWRNSRKIRSTNCFDCERDRMLNLCSIKCYDSTIPLAELIYSHKLIKIINIKITICCAIDICMTQYIDFYKMQNFLKKGLDMCIYSYNLYSIKLSRKNNQEKKGNNFDNPALFHTMGALYYIIQEIYHDCIHY